MELKEARETGNVFRRLSWGPKGRWLRFLEGNFMELSDSIETWEENMEYIFCDEDGEHYHPTEEDEKANDWVISKAVKPKPKGRLTVVKEYYNDF